jgi:hypothetical protein
MAGGYVGAEGGYPADEASRAKTFPLVVLAGHNPNFLAALLKELERIGVSPSDDSSARCLA